MTIIRPNSISGINSITAKNTDQMKLYDSNGAWSHVRAGVITATKFVGPLTGTASQLETNATGANLTLSGDLGVAGTLTYEDVTRVDAVGLSTFREGFGVGPLAGIALTAYKDGSIRTSGVITATTYYGSGSNLTGIDATQIVTGNTSVQTVDTGSDGHVKATTEGSERLRIDSAGEVLIGATARGREKGLHLAGANQDPGGVWTQMGIYSTDTQAANKGGSIGFGGQDGSLDKQQFAAIKGAKENSTSGNYAGYMSFYTRPNGNVTAERLRIGQNSNNSPVGSFGTGSSHLNNNTNPDRASFKVGGRLHVEGAFGHNAMCGLYYNCYSGGNDLFYGGTYTPSGGDGRASAITMRYGGVAILTDSSSTAYSPTTQITTMGTALSVGREGYVTTPKNPCVTMSVSSTYKDSHYLQHSTVNTNIGSHYSTSTCIFTCPVAGLYFCSLMVMSNNNNDTMDFELHKNGGNMNSILVPYNAPTGGSYIQVTGQCILHCASGDELRFKRNNGSVYGGRHSNITFALIG